MIHDLLLKYINDDCILENSNKQHLVLFTHDPFVYQFHQAKEASRNIAGGIISHSMLMSIVISYQSVKSCSSANSYHML